MKIDRVTVTGADDSVENIEELRDIQQEFPFVEWGILLSSSSAGTNRFPSEEWIGKLVAGHGDIKEDLRFKLAGHICGKWIREICTGEWTIFEAGLKGTGHGQIGYFDRLQLNWHGEKRTMTEGWLAKFKLWNESRNKYELNEVQLIFQLDGVNNHLLQEALDEGLSASGLIDGSHGAGVLPEDKWPVPFEGAYTGYAGGLGPHNLEEQLHKIADVCGDKPIWIDAETHLRSDDDKTFDLQKVRQFLEIAKPWVT